MSASQRHINEKTHTKPFFSNIYKVVLYFVCMLSATAYLSAADHEFGYEATLTGSFGKGDFAPSYLSANNNGILTQPNTTTLRLSAGGTVENIGNITLCFGVDVIGGYSSSTKYDLYDATTGELNPREAKNSNFHLQQLYAEMGYRGIFAAVGMQEHYSVLVNQDLSSGDLCYSGNTRPMPGLSVGFSDFQNIPLTKGWLQINGEIGYYKATDDKWKDNRYNYYNSFITKGYFLNYKYLHLRTNPDRAFSLTLGMQASCQIGGKIYYYDKGELTKVVENGLGLKEFWSAFIPTTGGTNAGDAAFVCGNHVGTWDILGRYRLSSGDDIMLYYQSPWEDGSGIGMLNGFDGLYGFEYRKDGEGIIDGAVIEYLDLTNQSGPIHWAPGDAPGTKNTDSATGADDYYNNYAYDGYQYYGLSIGTPFVRSAIYNTDGYMRITDNKIRAFHIALQGHLSSQFQYRMKFGYRKSWGTPMIPLTKTRQATSFMVEGIYDFPKIDGLRIKAQFGMDKGELVGDNTCGLISISYSGLFGF